MKLKMKLKMKKVAYLILIMAYACSPQQITQDEPVVIDVFNNSNPEIEFESIELIPLETNEDILIGDFWRLKVEMDEDGFYFANQDNPTSVFRFDSKGNFLNLIGHHGNGPEEYNGIIDFCIHGDTLDVLCNGGTTSLIVGYDIDGSYLYSKTVDLNLNSFDWFDAGYLFAVSYGTTDLQPYKICKADENGFVTQSFMKNTSSINVPVTEENFTNSSNTVFYHESFNDTIYMYKDEDYKPAYVLDFGDYKIPEEFYQVDVMSAFQLIMSQGFGYIDIMLDTPAYSFFQVSKQGEKVDNITSNLLLNKSDYKVFSESIDLDKVESPFMFPMYGTSNDEFIFLIYPYMILEDTEEFKKLPITNPQVIETLNTNDNPVIAICRVNSDR